MSLISVKVKQKKQYSGNPCLLLILKKKVRLVGKQNKFQTFVKTVLPYQYRVSQKRNELTLKKCGKNFTYDDDLKCSTNFSFVFFFVYGVDLSEWHNGMHQLITITVAAFQTKYLSTYSKGSRA